MSNVTKGGVQRLNLDQITLDGTVVTATGAELNIMDGVTATAAEINNTCDLTGMTGTFTANGDSAVTVANANVAAGSSIVLTLKTVGGTVGAIPSIKTITAGTGFTISGTASDTSVYNYRIFN